MQYTCKSIYIIYSFVYLATYPSICLSVYRSICLSVYLSVCLSICLSANQSVLSICLSICVSVYLVYLCICVSVYLSICVDICVSIYLSVYLSSYLSIYLSLYLNLSIYQRKAPPPPSPPRRQPSSVSCLIHCHQPLFDSGGTILTSVKNCRRRLGFWNCTRFESKQSCRFLNTFQVMNGKLIFPASIAHSDFCFWTSQTT